MLEKDETRTNGQTLGFCKLSLNGFLPKASVSCVFLTDLECSDFGDAPDYPVLWVSTEKGEAPFGQIVLM